MTKENIDFTLIKEKIQEDTKIANYVKNLLKNTDYRNLSAEKLTPDAIRLAYKFAKTNIQISNEIGIPMTPMFKTTINKRNMDLEFTAIYDRLVI